MELWDAYTRDGQLTGETLVRGQPIPDGRYHLVCEVLVRHADGDYLCMRRSMEKPNFPGYYEATAGGSALRGEDKWQCVTRELREETGISCDSFTEVGLHIADDGHCIFYSFVCTVDCDKDAVTLQAGETEGYKWMNEQEFIAFVNSDAMVPSQKRRLRPYLVKLGYLDESEQLLLTPAELVDNGICPTCYDRTHGHCLYGDPADKLLYENDLFACMLIGAPRAPGHAVIVTKAHYKDMMDAPDDLCSAVYVFARKAMNAIRTVYGARSVYLCTMCDGPMNHFHVQLIPRYSHEKRGSRNFVKERKPYQPDVEKIEKLRELLRK